MALTDKEKNELDVFMYNNIDRYLTMSSIPISLIRSDMENNGLTFPLKLVSLQASGRRIDENISIKRDGAVLIFTASKILKFQGGYYEYGNVIKEKNIFHLTGYEGLQYDIITKEFNMDIRNCKDFNRHYKDFEYNVNNYEWIFNYNNSYDKIFDIIQICKRFEIKTMPKGLAKELKDCSLTAEFLKSYFLKEYCGKYFYISEKLMYCVPDVEIPEYIKVLSWINKNIPFESFMKMIKNELLSESYNINMILNHAYSLTNFINKVKDMLEKCDDKEPFKFNFERSLTYNCNAMKDYVNREKNKKLAIKLHAFNFINDLKINDDKYIIVVPQSQADKREEARQQNNCVGYFYDDYILSDNGTVYFIRKTNNKNHSFITCRYDYKANKTVEARYVNNDSISKEDKKIIENLDEIIRKKLYEKRKEEN